MAGDELEIAAIIVPMPTAEMPIVVSFFIKWRRGICPVRTSSTISGILCSSSCMISSYNGNMLYSKHQHGYLGRDWQIQTCLFTRSLLFHQYSQTLA